MRRASFPRRVRPKDLAWVDADHVLVAHTTSRVEGRPVEEVPHSALALFRIDLASGRYRRLRSEPIKESHVDCVIFQRGLVFTSTQDSHQVYVHRLFRKGRLRRAWRFERIAVLEGYDRPHGLAFHAESGLLAATNYGDNTVRIRRLDDAILARMEPAS